MSYGWGMEQIAWRFTLGDRRVLCLREIAAEDAGHAFVGIHRYIAEKGDVGVQRDPAHLLEHRIPLRHAIPAPGCIKLATPWFRMML